MDLSYVEEVKFIYHLHKTNYESNPTKKKRTTYEVIEPNINVITLVPNLMGFLFEFIAFRRTYFHN